MNDKQQAGAPGGISLGDIYYVLFRHKWKIIIISSLGLLTAAGIYIFNPPPYMSQAKLVIRYVKDEKETTTTGPLDPKAYASIDDRGDTLVNTELEILTSQDTFKNTVTSVTAAKILAKAGGGTNEAAALGQLVLNVHADQVKKSSVLNVTYSNPDSTVVQSILSALIVEFYKEDAKLHGRSADYAAQLQAFTDELNRQVGDAQKQLSAVLNEAGVLSPEEATKGFTDRITTINQNLVNYSADLAAHEAQLAELAKSQPGKAAAAKSGDTNAAPVEAIPQSLIDRYKELGTTIEKLDAQKTTLSMSYTTNFPLLREVADELAASRLERHKLEDDHAGLPAAAQAVQRAVSGQSPAGVADPYQAELLVVRGLQSRVESLSNSLSQVEAKSAKFSGMQEQIARLQRDVNARETNYLAYLNLMQNAESEDEMTSVKAASAIRTSQNPSLPSRDFKPTVKMMAVAAGGGIVGSLLLAFMIEFYLDPSIKRPREIETKLGMRLFLSIPDINRNGRRHLANGESNGKLLIKDKEGEPEVETPGANGNGHGVPAKAGRMDVATWDHNHALHPYHEALRDRLINYFEMHNLTHKPKLVAVTGVRHGAGATTIAAGLAASLSDTGDGNVLLVDMNQEHGAAQQFFKGKPGCGLDDALEAQTRDNALVQDKLYVVSGGGGNGDQLPRLMPKRFAKLVPKLKASDYDYIIFDMPPVSQTSLTLRLAGFMDMVLLAVQSEKTDREVIQQANSLLSEAKANVSVIVNKTRSYVPARLQQAI